MQDANGLIEKSELAEKVKEVASQGPEGQASTAPAGYTYDAASGQELSSALISCLSACSVELIFLLTDIWVAAERL